jgi:hypothetical protein
MAASIILESDDEFESWLHQMAVMWLYLPNILLILLCE